jgi:hypothetical protein
MINGLLALASVKSSQDFVLDYLNNSTYDEMLGIDLNEAELLKHPFQPIQLRHYRGDLTNIRPVDAIKYYKMEN